VVIPDGGWDKLRNTGAHLLLKDYAGRVISEANYEDRPDSKQGRSTERVNPGFEEPLWGPSAAAQGSTPGHQNSLYIEQIPDDVAIRISNNPFSPDGDLHEDFCLITVDLPAAYGVLHAMIFDIHGRLLKTLVDGTQVSSHYVFSWDGTDENRRRLPTGPYILYIERLLPSLENLTASKHLVVIASSP